LGARSALVLLSELVALSIFVSGARELLLLLDDGSIRAYAGCRKRAATHNALPEAFHIT